jgi:hypothetical protein
MIRPYDHLQEEFPMYIIPLKMVLRPKHVADNLNKIVKNY